MRRIEENLAALRETVSILKEFILADDLFWPLQSRSLRGFPRISLGALLLIVDELQAVHAQLTEAQRQSFLALQDQVEDTFAEWRIAVGKKADREIHMRANLWRAYLQDLQENPDLIHDFANEVRNRAIMVRLTKIESDARISERERRKFQRLEGNRDLLDPGGVFVWDKQLESIYPFEEYPFLYR